MISVFETPSQTPRYFEKKNYLDYTASLRVKSRLQSYYPSLSLGGCTCSRFTTSRNIKVSSVDYSSCNGYRLVLRHKVPCNPSSVVPAYGYMCPLHLCTTSSHCVHPPSQLRPTALLPLPPVSYPRRNITFHTKIPRLCDDT